MILVAARYCVFVLYRLWVTIYLLTMDYDRLKIAHCPSWGTKMAISTTAGMDVVDSWTAMYA